MNYRSKDIPYMTNVKTAIYNLSQNGVTAPVSWEYLRRYIVVEDLRNFINNSNEINYIAEFHENTEYIDIDILFVTLTNTKAELEVFKKFLLAIGIGEYYRTSYTRNSRSAIVYKPALTSALRSELKTIAPKKIMIFGSDIAKQLGIDITPHQVCDYNSSKLIVTSSIVQLLIKPELSNAIKATIWSDFKALNS